MRMIGAAGSVVSGSGLKEIDPGPASPEPGAPRAGRGPENPAAESEETGEPRLAGLAVYRSLGLEPLDFQIAALKAAQTESGGLIEVPTGSGKTLAVMAAPIASLHREARAARTQGIPLPPGLRVIFITPLRALSRDTERAVRTALAAAPSAPSAPPPSALHAPEPPEDAPAPASHAPADTHDTLSPGTAPPPSPITVECRTGDIPASRRTRQLKAMPHILITTPESLSLLLARPDTPALFARLSTVIIDEWHELLSTKRGTQTELALARLRTLRPEIRTWALSATIGNPQQAARAACGIHSAPAVIQSSITRPVAIEIIPPPPKNPLPWSGHLGTAMLPQLLRRLNPRTPTLIFTNTRKVAERWYLELLRTPGIPHERIALHHGSIDRTVRTEIENAMHQGTITWVIATSSLDLGIDFAPVETVVQIGSPKSIARLIQRAGRSAHQPGRTSRLIFVPTHALELLEIHAARRALRSALIEPRIPLKKPLDVLSQHMVTLACGEGFRTDQLFSELKTTAAYSGLTRDEFQWTLDFVSTGGSSLKTYDHYRKIQPVEGLWRVRNPKIARLHRISIGTIAGNSMVRVAFTNGRRLGEVEEPFISALRKGDTFSFAGRSLELVMIRDMTAYVRTAPRLTRRTPAWPGGALPYSASLAAQLRDFLAEAPREEVTPPPPKNPTTPGSPASIHPPAASPQTPPSPQPLVNQTPIDPPTAAILQAQRRISALPAANQVLAEILTARGARHLFLFPFEGRAVHDGLASLLTHRLADRHPGSFAVTTNDYGLQIESAADCPFAEHLADPALFSAENLEDELQKAANIHELARRGFRGIARVSGLIFSGYPGAEHSARSLQVSAGLLYDVFRRHEPDNLLLRQARTEVLQTHFSTPRLTRVIRRIRASELLIRQTERPSPLAFPLLVDQLTQSRSSLSIEERVARIRRHYRVN